MVTRSVWYTAAAPLFGEREMKRYTPHTLPCVTPDNYTEMRKDSKGEWVKWNDPLVQAAPELLELLMELQDIVFLTRNNELHTLMEAAIAKATGG
jgi:hypothetical protein